MFELNYYLTMINDFLYSYILIALLLICGIYFTIKTRFIQIKLIPDAIKLLGEKKDDSKVSSFQALMISTASRVGTGNIAGITTALVTGGPGSIFWMWIMALFGGASAFIESTLAQVYKVKDDKNGGFRGGPSYYIQIALGKRNVGILFSVLLILCFAFGFNALQAYNISSSFEYYINNYNQTIWPFVVGLVLAFFTALIIFGGVHRIGFISSVIVPIMATVYLLLGIFITLKNINRFPDVINLVIKSAFDFKAIFGGFSGSVVLVGIKRGLFSNEAGMGSAPNAAATADVSHPVKQGAVQILSVFIDTLIICTTTASIVLFSGTSLDGHATGIPLMQESLKSQIGVFGIHFITFSILLFAFSSIIGNYCYAESNILFIKDNKYVMNIFRVICIIPVILGSVASSDIAWNFADIFMGLMAIVNIIAILLLSKTSLNVMNDYINQKKKGKDLVFIAKDNNIKNIKVWLKKYKETVDN